jgi:hypothetical protein
MRTNSSLSLILYPKARSDVISDAYEENIETGDRTDHHDYGAGGTLNDPR